MTGVLEEIDSKLESVFQIRTYPMTSQDADLKLELLTNLLLLYDETWTVEGPRVVIGNHHQAQPRKELKRALVQRKVRKWLKVADLGHLVAGGEGETSLVEGKKFSRLVTGLMDKLEGRHGGLGNLRVKVRDVAAREAKKAGGGGKENLSFDTMHESPEPPPVVPPPTTPLAEKVIPVGKQLPRTPPQQLDTTLSTTLNGSRVSPGSRRVSSFYSPAAELRKVAVTRVKRVTAMDFNDVSLNLQGSRETSRSYNASPAILSDTPSPSEETPRSDGSSPAIQSSTSSPSEICSRSTDVSHSIQSAPSNATKEILRPAGVSPATQTGNSGLSQETSRSPCLSPSLQSGSPPALQSGTPPSLESGTPPSLQSGTPPSLEYRNSGSPNEVSSTSSSHSSGTDTRISVPTDRLNSTLCTLPSQEGRVSNPPRIGDSPLHSAREECDPMKSDHVREDDCPRTQPSTATPRAVIAGGELSNATPLTVIAREPSTATPGTVIAEEGLHMATPGTLLARHVIPTGRQLAMTPPHSRPSIQAVSSASNNEPSGVYDIPSDLKKVAIPSQEELDRGEKDREEEENRRNIEAAHQLLDWKIKERKLKDQNEEILRLREALKVAEEKVRLYENERIIWDEGKLKLEEQKKLIENANQAKRNSEEERRKLLVKLKQERRVLEEEKIKLQEKENQEKTLVREEQRKLQEKAVLLDEREKTLRENEENNSRLRKQFMLKKNKLDEEKKQTKKIANVDEHKENVTLVEGKNVMPELGANCCDLTEASGRKNYSRHDSSKEKVHEVDKNDVIAVPASMYDNRLKDTSVTSEVKDVDAGDIGQRIEVPNDNGRKTKSQMLKEREAHKRELMKAKINKRKLSVENSIAKTDQVRLQHKEQMESYEKNKRVSKLFQSPNTTGRSRDSSSLALIENTSIVNSSRSLENPDNKQLSSSTSSSASEYRKGGGNDSNLSVKSIDPSPKVQKKKFLRIGRRIKKNEEALGETVNESTNPATSTECNKPSKPKEVVSAETDPPTVEKTVGENTVDGIENFARGELKRKSSLGNILKTVQKSISCGLTTDSLRTLESNDQYVKEQPSDVSTSTLNHKSLNQVSLKRSTRAKEMRNPGSPTPSNVDRRRRRNVKPSVLESPPKKSKNIDGENSEVDGITDISNLENNGSVLVKERVKKQQPKKGVNTLQSLNVKQTSERKAASETSLESEEFTKESEEDVLSSSRPVRVRRKKFENLQGMTESSTPPIKEDEPEKRTTRTRKGKTSAQTEDKKSAETEGKENLIPPSVSSDSLLLSRNQSKMSNCKSNRIEAAEDNLKPKGESPKNVENVAGRSKARRKKAILQTIDDEVYKTPKAMGSFNQVKDEQYETPVEPEKKHPRRKCRKK